jgi:hypothetical protein
LASFAIRRYARGKMRQGILGRLGLLGAAAVGAIVGHGVTYILAVWDEGSRHALLAETGHGYWDLALGTAIVLGLWLTGAVVLRHFHPGPRAVTSTGLWPLTLRLAGLQVVLFAALEVGERLVGAVPMSESLFHEVMSLGVAVQAVVALVIALLLRLLVRAAEVLAEVLLGSRPPVAASPVPRRSFHDPLRPVTVLAGGTGVRGPPSLS